ncbi:MAG TPA: TylF/MycF/NovP-related O-methyltransferase [Candidatus Cybelea sp.]|nr:TylF/MycF/NovP-related O-methyltransferase [Candidatus Cybelea sp.]
MSVPRRLKRELKDWSQRRRFLGIYGLLKEFTMIKPRIYVENLALAERVRDLPGCVVECGVWRGGMSAGIGKVMGPQRDYFLFDSFEGLPPAKEIDGKAAMDWQSDKDSPSYYENCAAGTEFAEKAMALAGIKSFHLKKGWFDKTLPGFKPPMPIALLRLDGDWYDSTMVCLSHLFDFVTPGGLIVLDDYYTWDGCSRALHDFLSRRSAAERIKSLDSVCFLEKKSPAESQKAASS